MTQVGWIHLDILWSGPLPHHFVTGLSTLVVVVYLIRILTGQSDPIMQVDREEHHQFVLVLPYILHGSTVSVCHGLSSGVWGLGWATPGLDTLLINLFLIFYRCL